MSRSRLRVAHVLPSMDVGGVEVGVKKSHEDLNRELDYQVFFVKKSGSLDVSQSSVWNLFGRVILGKNVPDVLITSLWWGHVVGLILYPRRLKWICFIHSTGYSSWFDRVFTRLALSLSEYHLFDSERTRDHFRSYNNKSNSIIPYVFTSGYTSEVFNTDLDLTFTWVGRNSKEKRLDLLIDFIQFLLERDVKFRIHICIAGDRFSAIDDLSQRHSEVVTVDYNVDTARVEEILQRSKITLCFSDYEGFSATIADAALHGNLICSRRVGELPNYLCEATTIWLDAITEDSWKTFMEEIIAIVGCEDKLLASRYRSWTYTTNALRSKNYISSLTRSINACVNS